MPRTLSVVLVLALVTAAGCGGGGDGSNGKKTGKTEKQGNKAKQEKKNSRACDVLGINAQGGKTGTCIRDKQRFTLVNRRSSLQLKELAIRLGSLSSEKTLSGPVGAVKPDKGKAFVLADVTWRNRDTRAHVFDKDQKQLKLRVGGEAFNISMRAENAFPTSFFNQGKTIKPGGTQRGTVIFQVKATAAGALKQRGADPQVLVWNFSTAGKNKPANGAIRLWK